MGINKFTDMTEAEINRFKGKRPVRACVRARAYVCVRARARVGVHARACACV